MAEPQVNASQQAVDPSKLGEQACRDNDVALMAQAISVAPGSVKSMRYFLIDNLKLAISEGAVQVVSYLLDQGAMYRAITAGHVFPRPDQGTSDKPSLEVLELLVAHGWDVNNRNMDDRCPLLWRVLRYPDLVDWCLDHGAEVYQPGDILPGDPKDHSLLETAASHATAATFDILKAMGAPFGPRTLHVAVEFAARHAPAYGSAPSAKFKERMEMVRHLVIGVGVDVNAEAHSLFEAYASPLHFVAHYAVDKDYTELVWFLLDSGADPNLRFNLWLESISALEYGERQRNMRFVEAVQGWQARQQHLTD